jgi:asparaginyl-tRNA synthetase
VDAFDLIVPGIGELVGGSQREERLEVLQRKMGEFGLEEKDYSWYLDLRRYVHIIFGICSMEYGTVYSSV